MVQQSGKIESLCLITIIWYYVDYDDDDDNEIINLANAKRAVNFASYHIHFLEII